MGGYALEEVKEINDQAQDLVTERFGLAEDLATSQSEAAETYLDALSQLFATAIMPDTEISYDFQNITLDSDLERPDAEEIALSDKVEELKTTFKENRALLSQELTEITVPTITIEPYILESFTQELEYDEPIYSSDLQNALKSVLGTFISTGGTGLGSDVEDALWARGRDRQAIINERKYNEAEEYFSTRNYSIPAGALGGRLTEALNEISRGDEQLNYEIMIEQARLARAQSEYSLKAALTLEGQDKERFTAMANRTLEVAKATAQVMIDVYNNKIKEYIAQYEGKKIEVEIEKLKIDAAIASNDNTIKILNVDLEAYKTQLNGELAVLELVAKVYGFTVAGYEADAKVAAADLDAQIKVYQGNIDQANNQTALSLKEAELTIQSYLGALQLTADSIKASGNISAQIAASALSAVNASASFGANASSSYGSSSNYSHSESDSESITETHYYEETAP